MCSNGDLISLIGRLKGRHILIVGDLMLDRFVYGKVTRISPEAPVPIVKVTSEITKLGGAGNVAQNIKSLGGEPYLIAVAGEDREADTLAGLMQKLGISTEGIVRLKSRPTIIKTRILAERQQVVRLDNEDDNQIEDESIRPVLEKISALLGHADAVIVSDYNKGLITPFLISFLVEKIGSSKLLAVDPKPANYRCYKGVGIITPNLKEASEMAVIKIQRDEDLLAAAEHIFKELGNKSILVTLGERGMALFESRGKPVQWLPTRAREVFDVTGAGDTVIATFMLALSAGASMRLAAELANYAAGIVVSKLGTAVVTPEELKDYINDSGE